jgi:glucose uptake protein GlcU
MKMGLKKEWEKEKTVHKYSSYAFVMSRVGVLVLVLLSVISIRFFRPLYDTVDVIVILAVGMILGAVYVRSQEKISENFERKLEEIEKKDTKPP